MGEVDGAERGAGPLATPSPPVRARGSEPGSHTNQLREQSYFSVPVFSSEKRAVALNSVNCYSYISCKMETERRKRKK